MVSRAQKRRVARHDARHAAAEGRRLAEETVTLLTCVELVEIAHVASYQIAELVFREIEPGRWALMKNRWGSRGGVYDAASKTQLVLNYAKEVGSNTRPIKLLEVPWQP